MKRLLLPALLLTLSVQQMHAQRYLGVATGNYNAMNSLYLNPANIAGCNEKLTVTLFSVNVGVDNSLGTIASIGNISKALKSNDSGSTNSIFTYSGNKKFSMMVPSVEVRGPGVMLSINDRNTIAVTTRIRAFNEFNNFDRSLFDAVQQTNSVQNGVTLNSQNFNWIAHVWSEIGLTYGAVVVDNSDVQVKAGVTVRYLGGILYQGLKGKNLDAKYIGGTDSLVATNSDLEFATNVGSSTDALSSGASSSNLLGNLFGNGASGFGADLGVTLVYKPDNGNSYGDDAGSSGRTGGYKAALSASITDIGSINYKTSYAANVTGNGILTGAGIAANVKNYQDFSTYARTQGFTLDTGVKATKVSLPTSLIISGDYNVYNKIYVSALYIANLASTTGFGSVYYSQLSITPRYDTRLFSAGLPLTYSMLTHNMRLGLGLRLSGFFIGSDDMLALLSDHQYGFNFYLGGMIPLYKKHRNGDMGAN